MSPSGLIPASLSKTLYYPEKIHWLQAIQRQICLNRSLYTVSSGKAVAGRARCVARAEPNAREWSMARRKRHLEFYSKPFIVFRARPLTVLACLAKAAPEPALLLVGFFFFNSRTVQAGGEIIILIKKTDKNGAFSMAAFKQFMSFCCQCDVEIHQMCHKAFKKEEKKAATLWRRLQRFHMKGQGSRNNWSLSLIWLVWTQSRQTTHKHAWKKLCSWRWCNFELFFLEDVSISFKTSKSQINKWNTANKQTKQNHTTIKHAAAPERVCPANRSSRGEKSF